eukprot:Sspe_Gene.65305::Locus_38666_Transcript_2_2_Confidence_0.667_Length_1604::g.65305::m.65305
MAFQRALSPPRGPPQAHPALPLTLSPPKPLPPSSLPSRPLPVRTLRPPGAFRQRLINFYMHYCPEKLPNVTMTVSEYQGMELSLFTTLVRQYGPEPPNLPLDANLPEGWKCVENSAGHIFYVHESGIKQWKKPTAPLPRPKEPPQHSRQLSPSRVPPPTRPARVAEPPHRHIPAPSVMVREAKEVGSVGVKKALLVATGESAGPQRKMGLFLGRRGFSQQLVLSGARASRVGILKAVRWLTHDIMAGDSIFFHFVGVGGQGGGCLPADHLTSAPISEDELYFHLVQALPQGARLTALLDVAPCGVGVDLPYQYYISSTGFSTRSPQKIREPSKALVTVIGTAEGALASPGALTHALVEVLTRDPNPTFAQLLEGLKWVMEDEVTPLDSPVPSFPLVASTTAFEPSSRLHLSCSLDPLHPVLPLPPAPLMSEPPHQHIEMSKEQQLQHLEHLVAALEAADAPTEELMADAVSLLQSTMKSKTPVGSALSQGSSPAQE